MENNNFMGELFPEYEFNISNSNFSKKRSNHHKRKRNLDCHLEDYINMTTTGFYDMPILSPVHISSVPVYQVPFNQFVVNSSSRFVWVHSFIDDYLFQRIWHNPKKYEHIFRSAGFVTPSDFSILIGMPEAEKIEHIYRNRYLERYYQDMGVVVIPNVSWADEKSFVYCFDGLPKHSTIAINCNGIIGNQESVYFWRKGYEKTIEILEPEMIFRYGDKLEGELEEISVYFKNENLRRIRNGR